MSISNLEFFERGFRRLENLSTLKAFKRYYLKIVKARESQINSATNGSVAVQDHKESIENLKREIAPGDDSIDEIIRLELGFEQDLLLRKVNRDTQRHDVRQKDYVGLLTRLAVGVDLRVDQFFDLVRDPGPAKFAPVVALHNAAVFGAMTLADAREWVLRFQRDRWLIQADPIQFPGHKLAFLLRALHGTEQMFQFHQSCVDALLERGHRDASFFKAASNWLYKMGSADEEKNHEHASLFLLRSVKESKDSNAATGRTKRTAGQVNALRSSLRALMDYHEQILHLGLSGVASHVEDLELKDVEDLIKKRLDELEADLNNPQIKELQAQLNKRNLKSMMRKGEFLEVADLLSKKASAEVPADPEDDHEVQRLYLLGECALERGQSLQALIYLLRIAAEIKQTETTEFGARARLLLARAFKHLGCNRRAEEMLVQLDRDTRGLIDEPLQVRIRMQIARLKANLLSRHSREYHHQVLRQLQDFRRNTEVGRDPFPIHMGLRLKIEEAVISEKQGKQHAGAAVTKACEAADALASLSRHRWLESARADLEVSRLLRRAGQLDEVDRKLDPEFLDQLRKRSGWHYVEACQTLARSAQMRENFMAACACWIEVLDWSCAGFVRNDLQWKEQADTDRLPEDPVTQVCTRLEALTPVPQLWVAWDLILQAVSGLAEAVRSAGVGNENLLNAIELLRCVLTMHEKYQVQAKLVSWWKLPKPAASTDLIEPVPWKPTPAAEPRKPSRLVRMASTLSSIVTGKTADQKGPVPPQTAPPRATSAPESDELINKLKEGWKKIVQVKQDLPESLTDIEEDGSDSSERTTGKKRRTLRERLLLQLQLELERLEWTCRALKPVIEIDNKRLESYLEIVSTQLSMKSFVDHLPSVTLRAIADSCSAILYSVGLSIFKPDELLPASESESEKLTSWPKLCESLLNHRERLGQAEKALKEVNQRHPIAVEWPIIEMKRLIDRLVNDCYAPALRELRQSDQSDVHEEKLNRLAINDSLKYGWFLLFDPQQRRSLL